MKTIDPIPGHILDRPTRRWVRRHQRRHGGPAAVVIRVRNNYTLVPTGGPAGINESSLVQARSVGVAHCGGCGESRPAYDRTVLGFDGARQAIA